MCPGGFAVARRRGEETVERARAKRTRSMGEVVQHIHPDHQLVMWSKMQIWIGVRPRDKTQYCVVAVAPCADGARRSLRVVKKSVENTEALTEVDLYARGSSSTGR